MSWRVDHLVVGARTLDEGVDWCEANFGIVPGPGGEHPTMGTHNRLFAIGSASFPQAYFEIIAVNPAAAAPGRTRWYDLDDAAVQAALARSPALIHWVAACDAIEAECESLRGHGIDRGEVLRVERATPNGLLRWRISVRSDGARLAGGALPTLIEWDGVHPAETLPPSGVQIERLTLAGLPAAVVDRLPAGVTAASPAGAAPLVANFTTPRGAVRLESLSSQRATP